MRILRRMLSVSLFSVFLVCAFLIAPSGERLIAHADVDDYSYQSWQVDTHLSTTADGRALATFTETLVVGFPDTDQNKGVVRALPFTFERADAVPKNITVHDAAGKPVPFTTDDEEDFFRILVGDDNYVHGTQTYVISYEIHDVIRNTPNSTAGSESPTDEWYWDIIPLERVQHIAAASATVTFDPALAAQLTGARACYYGEAYATTRCELTQLDTDPLSLALAPMPLPGGSGITLAVDFTANSVIQPAVRLPNPLLDIGPMVAGSLAFVAGLSAAIIVWVVQRRRSRHRGTIVAQYDVPSNLPPLISASIVKQKKSVIAAQIVHLAVNGIVRFEQPEEPSKSKTPLIRLLNTDATAEPLDAATRTALFGEAEQRSVLTIPKHSEAFGEKMQKLTAKGDSEAKERGYLETVRLRLPFILGIAAYLFAAITVILLVMGNDRAVAVTWLVSLPTLIVGSMLALFGVSKTELHTPLGAESREYLLGVREFIRVAEANRIRMLQSVTGSERVDDNGISVLRVYELLTPYAVLFGEEQEWAKVLESLYTAHEIDSPRWYPAIGSLGMMNFNQSFTHLTHNFSSSASYTTSSSGGTGTSGFSGGGGGGGYSGGR